MAVTAFYRNEQILPSKQFPVNYPKILKTLYQSRDFWGAYAAGVTVLGSAD